MCYDRINGGRDPALFWHYNLDVKRLNSFCEKMLTYFPTYDILYMKREKETRL